jgi:hypothetical protein
VLERVISGGQTGADQAPLRAARAFGIPTGGFAPKGWLVETPDGRCTVPAPWLADWGLVECDEPGFPARTRANVRAGDATLWFGNYETPGGMATLDACRACSAWKPFLLLDQGIARPSQAAEFIEAKGVRVLNVAGNRESEARGIGRRVERFMRDVFRRLGHAEVG